MGVSGWKWSVICAKRNSLPQEITQFIQERSHTLVIDVYQYFYMYHKSMASFLCVSLSVRSKLFYMYFYTCLLLPCGDLILQGPIFNFARRSLANAEPILKIAWKHPWKILVFSLRYCINLFQGENGVWYMSKKKFSSTGDLTVHTRKKPYSCD